MLVEVVLKIDGKLKVSIFPSQRMGTFG
jgi:hypothetical protein